MTTTAPTTAETFTVRLLHRNGGTTDHNGLTLDEARSLSTRSLQRRKARAAEIRDVDGNVVGYTEAAA